MEVAPHPWVELLRDGGIFGGRKATTHKTRVVGIHHLSSLGSGAALSGQRPTFHEYAALNLETQRDVSPSPAWT
jgi:hypothetical protein